MLLWINGPFGGGKTHAADEIGRRLAGSIICDPEDLGYGLHRMMPSELRGDFQDLAAWRHGTFEVLERFARRKHQGDVIVPMTVIEPAYLDEILRPLGENGYQVRHYTLLAERETILQPRCGEGVPCRLGAKPTPKASWTRNALDRLGHDDFAEHLRTRRAYDRADGRSASLPRLA